MFLQDRPKRRRDDPLCEPWRATVSLVPTLPRGNVRRAAPRYVPSFPHSRVGTSVAPPRGMFPRSHAPAWERPSCRSAVCLTSIQEVILDVFLGREVAMIHIN